MSLENWYLRRACREVVHMLVVIKRQSPYSGIAWTEHTELCKLPPGTSFDRMNRDDEEEAKADITCARCLYRLFVINVASLEPKP